MPGTNPMIRANKAVFLSYASQDAEAALRICESLRAAGVEVWFDQSELRGGDAWDQKIRRQIKECSLFMPIISRNTQERREGYFRREWRMGVDRMADMDDNLTFLLPVIIDDTRDSGLHVPERFHERQWIRLPGGETLPGFGEWVRKLMDGEDAKLAAAAKPAPAPEKKPGGGVPPAPRPVFEKAWFLRSAGAATAVLVLVVWLSRSEPEQPVEKPVAANVNARTSPRTGAPATPRSEAFRLVERAREITQALSLTREQLEAAAALCKSALELDANDARVWAEAARTDMLMIFPGGFDRSEQRRKQAQERAARAVSLAPDSTDVKVVQTAVLAHAVGTPALLDEAERTFRKLAAASPEDRELVIRLAEVLREKKHFSDAAGMFERVGEFEHAAWSHFQGGDAQAALAAMQRDLDQRQSIGALQLKALLQSSALEDLDAAQATIDQIPPSELVAEKPAAVALRVAVWRRDPDRALQIAQALSRDFIDSNVFRGPRQYFTGLAHEMAGRKAAAEADWKAGIVVIEEQLKAAPGDRELLLMQAWLLASTGDRRKAERTLAQAQSVAGRKADAVDAENARIFLRLGKTDPVLAWLTSHLAAKPAMWEAQHAEARYSPSYDKLRGERKFEVLLRETSPMGAVAFAELPAEEKPKGFWSRL